MSEASHDIVELLRQAKNHVCAASDGTDVCLAAADEIERLRVENGRLQYSLERAREFARDAWPS